MYVGWDFPWFSLTWTPSRDSLSHSQLSTKPGQLHGGTGTIGGALIKALSTRGERPRALVRTFDAKAEAIRLPGVTLVQGDLAQPETLAAALDGVDRLFLLSVVGPAQAEWQGAAIVAAKAAGVKHIVKLSALGAAADSPVVFQRWHAQTEAQLAASGVPYTILRPNNFFTNLLNSAGTISVQGVFYQPQSADAPVSMVDPRDIAAVAAVTLTSAGHEGKTYDITGPAALSNTAVAQTLTSVLGKPVAFVQIPAEAATAAMTGAGMPAWLADGLIDLARFCDTGAAAGVTDVVRTVTGKEPITLAQFVRENAAAFGGVATPAT